MGFLKQWLGRYLSGHGNKHGNKHGNRSKHNEWYPPSNYNKHDNVNVTHSSSKTCPNCNTANVSDAKFCQQCGTIMVVSNCTQCKTSLLPDAKFCPQCGKLR